MTASSLPGLFVSLRSVAFASDDDTSPQTFFSRFRQTTKGVCRDSPSDGEKCRSFLLTEGNRDRAHARPTNTPVPVPLPDQDVSDSSILKVEVEVEIDFLADDDGFGIQSLVGT
jgi:hypothetical protein